VEVARVFGTLGLIGFGGPAAHIALMRDELVVRRKWVDDQAFLDLVGAVNLIPGPNSTELAIHLGHRRAGRWGLVVAGTCFIAPAVVIVGALAWVYVRYGRSDIGADLLWGVKAVMLAIVLGAIVALARTAVGDVRTCIVTLGAFGAYLAGVNELVLLAMGAVVVAGTRAIPRRAPAFFAGAIAVASTDVQHWRLAGAFLKVGALLFGSGYVLLAFLRNDLVRGLGWLTEQQLLDAIAIGQVTPGPLFSTATFIGYVLAGWSGALVATIAIFLPSFVFVALTARLIPRIRRTPWASAALDGVNAAAIGLLAGVLVVLARQALTDWWAVVLALASAVLVLVARVNGAWLVLAGALIGLLRTVVS
jgi:chromate transporter